MVIVAGAQEAGQTPQTAEQTPPASEQIPEPQPKAPGFGERGRMRRRARFLRRARELAYRDLGGLVFDLHRFSQRNDQVVLAKLATLSQIDTELRALEATLGERRSITVLREVGIAACPRCAAIHGSDDRFCPGCGLAFDTGADRPISTAPVAVTTTPAPTPTPAPTQPSAPPSPPTRSILSPKPTGAPTNSPPTAPPVKPTAAPIPAKPSSTENENKNRENNRPAGVESGEEEQPTEILRPPARGS
jgi:hypothetical protein